MHLAVVLQVLHTACVYEQSGIYGRETALIRGTDTADKGSFWT